jgi:hypothetical protein
MVVFNLYSKRRKASENAGQPDTYQYHVLPPPLRVQIVHLWNDLFGPYDEYTNNPWPYFHDTIACEKGLVELGFHGNPRNRCVDYFTNWLTDDALDMIEFSFAEIGSHPEALNAAIEELNQRFREHGVGYQFSGGMIIRVDKRVPAGSPALSSEPL